MIEKLLVINVVALLVLGGVTISISVIVLRRARGYVELAEKRMEFLREGQVRLAKAIDQGGQSLRAGAGRDPQLLSEAERRAQARREIESRIRQLQQQLHELQEAQEDLEVRKEACAAHRGATLADSIQAQIQVDTAPEEARHRVEQPRAAEPGETRATDSTEKTRGEVGTRLARWHLHPDDDAAFSDGRDHGQSVPAQMFREHYDRYLENYQGYVKLAERLCSGSGEKGGSPREQDLEGRLRRLNDGIQRTTTRLDILEQYNPELATDDRISRRASIARAYADLEKRIREAERS